MESRTLVAGGDDAMNSLERAVIDARESLALWLRSGRDRKKLSLEDVAKVTKIQPRILEKLERGELDGLPADVFVKGFVRSFAKCVGLDEQEAIVRYGACKSSEAASTPVAKALVESMGLARKPHGTPAQATPVVAASAEEPGEAVVEISSPVEAAAPVIEAPPVLDEPSLVAEILAEPAPVVAAAPVVEPMSANANANTSSSSFSIDQPKKKRSRKKAAANGAPRARKKKGALSIEVNLAPSPEIAASLAPSTNEIAPPVGGIGITNLDVDDDAHTTQIVTISLDTGPVAKVDGESLFSATIEAKTDDAIVDASNATSDGAVEQPRLAEGSQRMSSSQIDVVDLSAIEPALDSTATEIVASEPEMSAVSGTWQPTIPPLPSTPSVPWRRPSITASRAYVVPTLVIDDADPDSADREREDRASAGKDHSRLSFLPPILLDREDRSSRQGGLTLAVIILLIAATLTLSYLMRRPSASGDGVTMTDERVATSQLYS